MAELKPESVFGVQVPAVTTAVPGPRSRALCADLARYESPSSSTIAAGDIPVVWEAASGANIRDVDGNVYVDLTGAFCVAGIGHGNPRVVAAIRDQAGRLLHAQGILNPSVPRVELVKRLAEVTPAGLERSILVNTGAEAVELALKTARLYTGRGTAVAFHGGFHGKTVGALAVTSRRQYRDPFRPLPLTGAHVPYPYCYRCPFGRSRPECDTFCARYLEYVLDDDSSGISDVGAVILEPIQGHDGWIVPPREFLTEVRRICTERSILLIFDEIITGFGRTGAWFAADHFGVVPDIMVLAKGIAGGFPISAVIARDEIMRAWGPAMHSSTFLGNPLGCAACLAAISEIAERNLVEVARRRGDQIMARLRRLLETEPAVGDVRGVGMMIGVELVTDQETRAPAGDLCGRVTVAAREHGVIVNQGGKFGNVLKLSPPFVITDEQTDAALTVLERCIGENAHER